MQPTFVIGDIHGHYEVLVTLLRGAQLVDRQARWCGENAHLWFIGDFVDRGPEGIGTIDLVMRLQDEAKRAGGHVGALLGNHEVLMLSAYQFGDVELETGGPAGSFFDDWELNGGRRTDIERLTPAHADWMIRLPAVVELGNDTLLMHADSTFYARYGTTVGEINTAFYDVLCSDDPDEWDDLLAAFSEHEGFINMSRSHVRHFLSSFGKQRLIHGHTPISYTRRMPPESVTTAYVYSDGQCINVDGGIYMGGSGFVHKVS